MHITVPVDVTPSVACVVTETRSATTPGVEFGEGTHTGGAAQVIADVAVPRTGRVTGAAIEALGTTLGAHVTVALAGAESGGATNPANLHLLCRHHRATTHGAWAVTMAPDGTCAWQSPIGHWLRTHPGDATAYRISVVEGMTIAARARAASSTGRAA